MIVKLLYTFKSTASFLAILRLQSSMETVRVRQTIPYITMDSYGMTGKKSPFPVKVCTTRYPAVKYPYSVVKNKAYSQFGIDMEREVARAIRGSHDSFLADSEIPDSDFSYLSDKDVIKYKPQIKEYVDTVASHFCKTYQPDDVNFIRYQDYFYIKSQNSMDGNGVHQVLEGHPDLVVWLSDTEVVIYDVKVFARTTHDINRQIRTQLSMYAALARAQGITVNTIGVIMPWARSPPVVEFDISKWDHTALLKLGIQAIPKVLYEDTHFQNWSMMLILANVGSHIRKETAEKISKCPHPVPKPFQIFLYGNNPSFDMETKGRAALYKNPPDYTRHNIFIHAPYNVVLCIDPSQTDWVVTAAQNYMRDATAIGARGVVFHTGHHPDSNTGIGILGKNLTRVLEVVDPRTPFLLETPCGNKNELLATPWEFSDFILQYPSDLVGVCVDTCHVFVSGHQPEDYILALHTNDDLDSPSLVDSAEERIRLIHFNGSCKTLGCHADGHAHPTTINNISDDQLVGVLEYAMKRNIPCVTE